MLLSSYRKLPIEVQFFEVKGGTELDSRKWCLGELIRKLPRQEFFHIWIETDTNHLGLDKSVLSETLFAEGKSSTVMFTHDDSRSQILLWLPDALAWIKTRGGNWHKELRGFSSRVFDFRQT
jgi:ubiquinone biosynthesis protein COQ9